MHLTASVYVSVDTGALLVCWIHFRCPPPTWKQGAAPPPRPLLPRVLECQVCGTDAHLVKSGWTWLGVEGVPTAVEARLEKDWGCRQGSRLGNSHQEPLRGVDRRHVGAEGFEHRNCVQEREADPRGGEWSRLVGLS